MLCVYITYVRLVDYVCNKYKLLACDEDELIFTFQQYGPILIFYAGQGKG